MAFELRPWALFKVVPQGLARVTAQQTKVPSKFWLGK